GSGHTHNDRDPPADRGDRSSSGRRMTVAADLFPGGVNSPVRAYRAVGGEPPVLVRGEGAFVWNDAGRRYIDYVGAFGPLLPGHANGRVREAIKNAAEAGGAFG